MKPYKDLSGTSGILAYSIGKDFIKIVFESDPVPYVYSWKKPGKTKVERMKRLAESGKGLATYINKYVRQDFDSRG